MELNQVVGKKFIQNVILRLKIKGMLKVWRKQSKNTKQRWYKLKQWASTEQSYLQKLIILRDQIKKPLIQANMITQYEQALMFPNLDAMIQLAMEMQNKINGLLSSWHPRNTLLAPTVESLVIYLKIYKQYSNNYSKADKIMIELKKRPEFQNIVKVPVVQDYTFKPIQRPLQYKLFLSDYIKLLPPTHSDKPNLQKALNVLLKIANQINQFVEKQSRAQKMITLQNLYGNIIESTREYRSHFQASHTDFNVKVHVFNDLLLVVKVISQFKDQKYMSINLCGGSYVIRQQNNKNFKDRLYICGTYQSIHLTFRCSQDANNAHNLIQTLIGQIYQKQFNRSQLLSQVKIKRQTMAMNRHSINIDQNYKWKQQSEYKLKLKIQVVGVQKRLYQKQWKIIYAVKIQLGRPQTIYQIVYYEIDQLKQIQRYLKQIYPSIVLPSLDTKLRGMNYQDAKVDFTKYFEYKCILIQDFLNFCLRCKELSKKIQFLIYKLKLHQSLWDYLNRFSLQCNCEACTNSQIISSFQNYKKQQNKIRKKKNQFCILNAFLCQNMLPEMIKPADFKKLDLQQKITWANCKQSRIQYGLQNRGRFGKKIEFHVSLLLVGEISQIYIEESTVSDTCREIVQQVCRRKGITQSNDFCLYYIHGKQQYYLDNDEYIYDAIKYLEENYKKLQSDKKNNANRVSIFNTFSRNMDDFGQTLNDFSIPDEPKLFLRKYIFLNPQLQLKACKKNPQRYPLILAQILRRFQNQILLLSIQQLRLFCALFYGAQQFNTIIFSKNIFCNEEKLKKLMPESKWSFVCHEFTQNIRQIIQKTVKPCHNIIQLYEIILKHFADKIGSYTQYFHAECLDPSIFAVKDKKLLIGVNMNKVIVSRMFNSISLLQFCLLKLQYIVSGDYLQIGTEDKCYKFYMNGLFLFEQLVQKYRLILQMDKAGKK